MSIKAFHSTTSAPLNRILAAKEVYEDLIARERWLEASNILEAAVELSMIVSPRDLEPNVQRQQLR
jgi:hypothetical protein